MNSQNNNLKVEFTPLTPGEHMLCVRKAGKEVAGSPFHIRVGSSKEFEKATHKVSIFLFIFKTITVNTYLTDPVILTYPYINANSLD